MDGGKYYKECMKFGHIGPLKVGSYVLSCKHCGTILAGSLPITVADLQKMLPPKPKAVKHGR